jgi:DNA-binding response OmpR family regulator
MTGILIVEDDALIARSLERSLHHEGYSVDVAASVAQARTTIDDSHHLVLCDLGLPDGDGLDLVHQFSHARPERPILILTAFGDESTVVRGLSAGAVDYITKPFRTAELLARIKAHLRHQQSVEVAELAALTLGDLVLDPQTRRVFCAEQEVELRAKEFDLLHRLARSANAVVHRRMLIHDVWGSDWVGSTKTLDVHINALRRKLGETPGGPSRISALRGVGYRLDVS